MLEELGWASNPPEQMMYAGKGIAGSHGSHTVLGKGLGGMCANLLQAAGNPLKGDEKVSHQTLHTSTASSQLPSGHSSAQCLQQQQLVPPRQKNGDGQQVRFLVGVFGSEFASTTRSSPDDSVTLLIIARCFCYPIDYRQMFLLPYLSSPDVSVTLFIIARCFCYPIYHRQVFLLPCFCARRQQFRV